MADDMTATTPTQVAEGAPQPLLWEPAEQSRSQRTEMTAMRTTRMPWKGARGGREVPHGAQRVAC